MTNRSWPERSVAPAGCRAAGIRMKNVRPLQENLSSVANSIFCENLTEGWMPDVGGPRSFCQNRSNHGGGNGIVWA